MEVWARAASTPRLDFSTWASLHLTCEVPTLKRVFSPGEGREGSWTKLPAVRPVLPPAREGSGDLGQDAKEAGWCTVRTRAGASQSACASSTLHTHTPHEMHTSYIVTHLTHTPHMRNTHSTQSRTHPTLAPHMRSMHRSHTCNPSSHCLCTPQINTEHTHYTQHSHAYSVHTRHIQQTHISHIHTHSHTQNMYCTEQIRNTYQAPCTVPFQMYISHTTQNKHTSHSRVYMHLTLHTCKCKLTHTTYMTIFYLWLTQ